MSKKKRAGRPTPTPPPPPTPPGGPPVGTTADKRIEADAHLPRCPVCQATRLRVIRETRPPMDYCGVDAKGRPYSRIRYKRCNCEACGAHPILRILEYDGPATPEIPESPEGTPAAGTPDTP